MIQKTLPDGEVPNNLLYVQIMIRKSTLINEDYFLPGVRGVTVLLLLPGCRAAVMNGWRWGAILP